MEFNSVKNLETYLRENPQRIKFPTKIYLVLNFTKKFPNAVNQCGAAWCDDNIHFISNATILGQLLHLKPNSINTNFRDHNFQINANTITHIPKRIPQLVSPNNWKIRSHIAGGFTAMSTYEDIENLQKSNISSEKVNILENSLPDFSILVGMNDFLQTHIPCSNTDNMLAARISILLQEYGNTSNLVEVLQQAITDWSLAYGDVTSITIQTFCSKIITNVSNQQQLMTNIIALLHKYQMDSTHVNLIDYLNFACHYGFLCDCAAIISTLTSNQNQPLNSSLPELMPPHFVDWFQPYLNLEAAHYVLSNSLDGTWFVSPSERPFLFNLFYYSQSLITTTPIEFNPFEKKFSIQLDDRISSDELNKILFQSLELDPNKALKSPSLLLPPSSVLASTLKRRFTHQNPQPTAIT